MIAQLKAYYAGMTPAQKARLWTLFITGLQGVAAVGDKITPTPFLPGWFVNAWPLIVTVDLGILKLINVLTDPNAVAKPPVSTPTNPPL